MLARKLERYVTKVAPHKALMLVAQEKLHFDEWEVLHRVDMHQTKHGNEGNNAF